MKHARALGWVCAAVCAGVAPANVVIDIPMDAQIDIGGGDAIFISSGSGSLSFESDGQDGWTRRHIGASGWYSLDVDFTLAGHGALDITGGDNTLEFECRYYQDNGNPYADAPVFVELRSATGGNRGFGIVYQTGHGWQCDPVERYPAWFHVSIVLNDLLGDFNCDGAPDVTESGTFDPTQVTSLRFFGTDWNYSDGDTDWIDFRNLRLVVEGQKLPPPFYSLTPVLFVPDPNSFPAGYQPTPAEIAEDLENLELAMQRGRRWFGRALGLSTSVRVNPVVYMQAEGGLADYGIEWTDPERRYRDGISIGATWGLVTGEVAARGYDSGSAGGPRSVAIFCKGAGGFAGGAQWHRDNGGGMCLLGDWCLDSMAGRVPLEWWDWWTGVDKQVSAAWHETGHTLGLPHPDALNPVTGQQDYPYTIMGSWWDWPNFPVNPADPNWPLTGLHAWSDNSGSTTVSGYQDIFLLDERAAWFAHPLADIDADGSVDLRDVAQFEPCFAAPPGDECAGADLDHSDAVDFTDYVTLDAAMTGPADR